MAQIEIEEQESETDSRVKQGIDELLGMTTKLKKDTQAYVDKINPDQALDRIAAIKQELHVDRGKVASYLGDVMSIRERLEAGSSYEDAKTFLDKLKNRVKSVAGLRKGFASMTDGEIINLLVGDFSARSHHLAERIDHVMEKRDEATAHMGVLKESRNDAIPMMQEAEAEIREMHKEKKRLEARLKQKLEPKVRTSVEHEYDMLRDSWFFAGEKLEEAAYTIELCSNVLGTMRVYKANIDNLLREARGLKRTVDITVETIQPSMKSIVTVANLATTVDETVHSHEVLRQYINTVLPKITEMTAYFPELISDSFDGKFFKEGLEEYMQDCDDVYKHMKGLDLIEKYKKAVIALDKEGLKPPAFDSVDDELVFQKPSSLAPEGDVSYAEGEDEGIGDVE